MKITDEQIATLKKQGFVIIENFLSKEEQKNVLEGFFRSFSPPYDEYIASGKQATTKDRYFPWDDSWLNHAMTHPDLIDAAERIIGTRELRLGQGQLGVKYYDMEKRPGTPPGAFHVDYGNNTLGPLMDPDDFNHLIFFYCFDDVLPGMGPIQMVPNGKPHSEAVKMIVPGGSVCIYTPFTVHAASEFEVPGHRAVAWVGYTRKDRPWDGARAFTGGLVNQRGMRRFIAEATPRQLELIGFPPVGDALWTDKFLDAMAKRYEGFNPEPYRKNA